MYVANKKIIKLIITSLLLYIRTGVPHSDNVTNPPMIKEEEKNGMIIC